MTLQDKVEIFEQFLLKLLSKACVNPTDMKKVQAWLKSES